jgi:hypothetical protein
MQGMMKFAGDFSLQQMQTLRDFSFDTLPPEHTCRIYGVEYLQLQDKDIGELFVTRFGWPLVKNLLPQSWYENQRYAKHGERLEVGTSAVYRVPTQTKLGRTQDLIVKFSRFAQNVPLEIAGTFLDDVPLEVIESAQFNSPFEEFGLLREMRLGWFGPRELKLRTKRALAIYSPAREYSRWRMGREEWQFEEYQREIKKETHNAFEFNARREYVVLYAWVKGRDAQEMYELGKITKNEMHELTQRVTRDMERKGFRVLDNKPRHIILRERPDGTLMRRHGELVYALIDFELLQRTEEYEAFLRTRRLNGVSG